MVLVDRPNLTCFDLHRNITRADPNPLTTLPIFPPPVMSDSVKVDESTLVIVLLIRTRVTTFIVTMLYYTKIISQATMGSIF